MSHGLSIETCNLTECHRTASSSDGLLKAAGLQPAQLLSHAMPPRQASHVCSKQELTFRPSLFNGRKVIQSAFARLPQIPKFKLSHYQIS